MIGWVSKPSGRSSEDVQLIIGKTWHPMAQRAHLQAPLPFFNIFFGWLDQIALAFFFHAFDPYITNQLIPFSTQLSDPSHGFQPTNLDFTTPNAANLPMGTLSESTPLLLGDTCGPFCCVLRVGRLRKKPANSINKYQQFSRSKGKRHGPYILPLSSAALPLSIWWITSPKTLILDLPALSHSIFNPFGFIKLFIPFHPRLKYVKMLTGWWVSSPGDASWGLTEAPPSSQAASHGLIRRRRAIFRGVPREARPSWAESWLLKDGDKATWWKKYKEIINKNHTCAWSNGFWWHAGFLQMSLLDLYIQKLQTI